MARLVRSFVQLHRSSTAVAERIAGVAGRTRANRNMIDHLALGLEAARARTRIHTLAAHTRPVAGAVRTAGAFRTARLVWVALVFVDARAFAVVAASVRSARRRIAQILGLFGQFGNGRL